MAILDTTGSGKNINQLQSKSDFDEFATGEKSGLCGGQKRFGLSNQ